MSETIVEEVEEFSEEENSNERLCACGCGGKLSVLARGEYLKGHKLAAYARESGSNNNVLPFEEAAKQPIRITKKMRDDMEGKLVILMTMLTVPFSMYDPVCGPAIEENVQNICAKLVPVISKSPEMVKWLTTGSNVTAWLDLMLAIAPVAKIIAAHHITHSIGSDDSQRLPNEAYTV